MRARLAAVLLPLLLLLLAIEPGSAQERVALRAASHPDYTRLVFEWPAPVAFESKEEAGSVTLRFARSGAVSIEPGRRWPAPIESVVASGRDVTVRFSAQARPRIFTLDKRVVLDLVAQQSPSPAGSADAASSAAPPAAAALPSAVVPPAAPPHAGPPPAASPGPAPPARAGLGPAAAIAGGGAPASAPASPPAAGPVPQQPVAMPTAGGNPATTSPAIRAPAEPPPSVAPEPVRSASPPRPEPPLSALSLSLAAQPARDAPERAILLPFGERVGAAAFRIGGFLHLVFDEPRPVDLSPLRGHPMFGGGRVAMLANGTHLRLPLPRGFVPRLTRQGSWRLDYDREPGLPAAPLELAQRQDPYRLLATTPQAAGSVTIAHPDTGERLLVGTIRADEGGIPVARTYAEFALLPSILGVVVLPRSDYVVLRAGPEGQTILADSPGGPLALALAPPPSGSARIGDAAHLTRAFDFPSLDPAILSERLRTLTVSVAGSPVGGRSRPRLDVAEAMLALGLGVEAMSMLELAQTEDPRIGSEPRLAALRGAAGLLSGRSEALPGLFHERLPLSDELGLWRSLAELARGAPPTRHAPNLAVALPLLVAYPAPLRERLIPPVVEALGQGGLPEMALILADQAPDQAKVELGRAYASRALGKTEDALAKLAAIDQGRDQLMRLRARIADTELQRELGRMTPAQAADRLDPLLVAWRGDQRELDLRFRIADLRTEANDHRAVLDLLRETRDLFPDRADLVEPRMMRSFATLFAPGGTADALAPSAAVALFEDNASLLPPGQEGIEISTRLAERLVALDLPAQADAMLRKVIGLKQPGEDQAMLGVKLASLRLGERDSVGALGALADTAAPNLPDRLARERRLIEARAEALGGNRDRARAILRALGGPEAAGVEAEISAAEGDWLSAIAALERVAETTLPADGRSLDPDARKLLVRLASAAAMAGDEVRLAALAQRWGKPMASGPLSEPFRLLTARGYAGVDDLARARGDLALARGLAASLGPLEAKPKP